MHNQLEQHNLKRILLISPFYKPEPIGSGKYNSVLADAILTKGHKVDVWCYHPLYPSWKIEKFSNPKEIETVTRGGLRLRFPKNTYFRRAILELTFIAFIIKRIFITKDSYDALIAIFPPSLFMLAIPFFGKRIRRRIGIIHDLQGIFLPENQNAAHHLLASMIKRIECMAFRNCDSLVFLSKEMQNLTEKVYGKKLPKCSMHYPFVTITEYNNQSNLNKLFCRKNLNIVYSGALGQKQNPERLIELFHGLSESMDNVTCHIFSEGPVFRNLKNQHESEKFRFSVLVNERDLPELLYRSDVQVIPQAENTSIGSLPSKLPNILASGTAVFAVTDSNSELQSLLSSFSGTCVATTWDIHQLRNQFQDFIQSLVPAQKFDRDTSLFAIEPLVDEILNTS